MADPAKRLISWFVLILLASVTVACGGGMSKKVDLGEDSSLRSFFNFDDETPRSIDYSQLRQGCPRVDCIPAIDAPTFIAVDEVDFLSADDLVMSVTFDGITRGYPTVILDQHEIVNDQFGETPIAATWCPLCGSALAFDRRVDGKTLDLAVSGFLHESDLVMFDRESRTMWNQVTGEALIGPMHGQQLTQLPSSMLPWSEWKVLYPGGRVLSTDTGFRFQYAGSMYRDYQQTDRLMFPISNALDDRLPAKSVVYGLRLGQTAIAIPETDLRQLGRVQLDIDGESVVIRWPDATLANVVAVTEGGEVPMVRLFWFAWANFNPGSQIFQP